jgi:hypothetical protein
MASVGSDTIYCVDKAIKKTNVLVVPPVLAFAQGCPAQPLTPNPYNIAANQTASGTAQSYVCDPSVSNNNGTCIPGGTPANPACTAPNNCPPDGSTAGVTALNADNGAGNFAFARSSGGRGSTFAGNTNLDFWAFALDAVTWSKFTGSVAPASMTAATLTNIYNCTWTDWSQVPGSTGSGTIQRFYPQAGSGTGKFFAQIYLNNVFPSNTGSCPSTYVEENDGASAAATSGFVAADAIFPYSFGVFTAQGNGTETNLHGGASLGKVNGTAATATTVSETEAFANVSGDACTGTPIAGAFCGTRYLYHVTDQALHTTFPTYQKSILAAVGVPTTGVAPSTGYCGNNATIVATLKKYGFKSLTKKTTAQTTSSDPVPGSSYCRQF